MTELETHPPAQVPPLIRAAQITTTVGGVTLLLLGALGGLLFTFTVFMAEDASATESAVIGLAIVVLGLGLGGALLWHGLNALWNRRSLSFQPPSGWWLFLPYIPVLIVGQLLISFDLWPALTFPLFHILAAAIPPLAILAFAGHTLSGAGVHWREIVLQLSSGAFLATSLALTVEIFFGLLILLLVSLIMALTPGGRETLQTLLTNLQDPLWLEDPQNTMQIFTFPPVLITLGVVFVVVGPLIEELAKPVGVILMSYRRPTPAQAFLWGLAGSAGFALAENFFNTTLALEVWALVIPFRIGATTMHCLSTSLATLGWQRFLSDRHLGKLAGSYGLAVAIHALWNGAVVGIAGLSVPFMDTSNQPLRVIAGIAILLLLALLLALTLGTIFGLILLTRRLQSTLPPT
jgi:RsiW-degrading membrane proteinase PrsW (M82 family)